MRRKRSGLEDVSCWISEIRDRPKTAYESRRLTLPWPPSVNHYYLSRRGGGRRISRDARAWQAHCLAAILAGGVETFRGCVRLTMDVWPPDHRRRDIDNLAKATCDVLECGKLISDDSQISELIIRRWKPEPPGKMIVQIDQVPDERDFA